MKSSILSASIVLSSVLFATGFATSPATYAASHVHISQKTVKQATSYPPMNLVLQTKAKRGGTSTDTIQLYGQPFSPGAPYYKKFLMSITNDRTGSVTFVPLSESGYKPTISYPHLINSSMPDIYIDSPTGGNGILSTDYLLTYQKGEFVGIAMPSTPVIHTKLLNHYRVQFQIPALKKTVVLSILDKKTAYDQAGVYHNGQLVKPFSLMIIPIGFFRPVVQKNGNTLLQGVQEISGLYHADGIATVFWNWQWTSQGWKLISAVIQK